MVQPYLFFGGRCEEALDFYRDALGAEVDMVARFSDSPDPIPPGTLPEGFADKVMHAQFRVGDSMLMASDGCSEGSSFSGFSLSLAPDTVEDAERIFSALADGGEVTMPLTPTFWSPCYGMLTDRFGVCWMVNVVGEQGA